MYFCYYLIIYIVDSNKLIVKWYFDELLLELDIYKVNIWNPNCYFSMRVYILFLVLLFRNIFKIYVFYAILFHQLPIHTTQNSMSKYES